MKTTRSRWLLVFVLTLAAHTVSPAQEQNELKSTQKENVHVFLLMGQSNMSGYAPLEPGDDKAVSGIISLPTISKDALAWQPARHPLHNRLGSDRFGLGLPFAIEYQKRHPGVTVALIPVAWGGAPIDQLNKGTPVYDDVLRKVAFAKKSGILKGVLWHQGESDTTTKAMADRYEAKLDTLISDLRRDLETPDLPFIAGNLAEFYGTSAEHNAPDRVARINQVRAILRALPQRVLNTAFVETIGLKSIDGHNVHFDRASYLELGQRYAAAFDNLASKPSPDWLINPAPYKPDVSLSADKKNLTLSNGLLRRTIRLVPNAATVEFDNPATGQTILRAVKPEAEITFNGKKWAIGGLIGQTCQNYLSPAMLDKMESEPDAYQFTRWEERPVEKRFDWKRHPEWLSRNPAWPVPGRHVVLHFAPPAASPDKLSGTPLFMEEFKTQLKDGWTIQQSKSHVDATFNHSGKPGEIYALPDTCMYAERTWPKGAVSVEVTVDVGDDTQANSWGPGFAIVAGSEKVSLVARPNSTTFELHGPGMGELIRGKFDRNKPVTLRARFHGKLLLLEAKQVDKAFERLAAVALTQTPTALRVGKVGKAGEGKDSKWKGSDRLYKSHILNVTVRGPEAQSAPPRSDLPGVEVHYEIYNGIPVIAKWLNLTNTTGKTIRLDSFASELLATAETAPKIDAGWTRNQLLTGMVPRDQKVLDLPPFLRNSPEAPLDYLDRFMDLFVVTDYAMGGDMEAMKDSPGVHWKHDPNYNRTGIEYYGLYQPAMLECSPPFGPALDLAPNEKWESFRAFEMLRDGTDRERRGLAECRFWSTFAPWSSENPIYMHITFSDPVKIRAAIDQCAEAGFEMMILSFGSGFNPESRDPKYLKNIKDMQVYAKSKGIVLGGYSLLASRGGAPGQLAISKATGKPALERIEGSHFGESPCLCSEWGLNYFKQLRDFYTATGVGVLEHDGSYPGDVCASTKHPGHRDFYDSQWRQWVQIRDFYRWCSGQGIYLNVPDWHFLNGANKEPMGYVESNWSLPRADQQIIARQNIYDGTFAKGPTMGWMFVPLTEYHGGGAAATVEPLSQHLDHYETQLASLFGSGVQACYRGPRLYDTDATKAVVKKWVNFYKSHRAILDSDLVHLRRPDGRDWDGMLHVNPHIKEKGLAMFYNPLPEPIVRRIRLPLYYTGITGRARIQYENGNIETVSLNNDSSVFISIKIPAKSRTWITVMEVEGAK